MFEKINLNLSPELKHIIEQKSPEVAGSYNRVKVYPKDIVCCFLMEDIPVISKIIDKFNIDKKQLLKDILSISPSSKTPTKKKGFDRSSFFILQVADRIKKTYKHQFISVEHVVLAFLEYTGKNKPLKDIKNIFIKHNLDSATFRIVIINDKKESYYLMNQIWGNKNLGIKTKKNQKKSVPENLSKIMLILEKGGFIENLNERMKKSDEVFVGREKEISRCIRILSRKKKRNIIIVGNPGVGKTALVEGLAKRITEGNVPKKIKDTNIFCLNLGNIVSGTKYRGQFEERMKNIINFAEESGKAGNKVIIFIDEIHTMLNTGSSEGSVSASTMIKLPLEREDIQCIGITTWDNYRKVFSKDEGLSRRFSKVFLDESSPEETINIVEKIKGEYEKFYSISISKEAVKETVKTCERFIIGKSFPDKAIDVLDESCSREITEKNSKKLNISTIYETVSEISGIPLTTVVGEEKKTLLNLEEDLKKNVIGQEEAVNLVVESIKRARIGIKDPQKPIGVYIFLGPTGVGKTHLAKKLSNVLFGREKIIRLDMSEYMEKISISKITGSPPGYVGYEEGSKIGEEIRKYPYSVVLLDEIEKAHVDVLNVFLQIFDEGRLTDNVGKTIDFRNAIFIMTSNLATKSIEKRNVIGFSGQKKYSQEEIEEIIRKEAKKHFSPEFLNRVDNLVIFNKISRKDIIKIFDLEIKEVKERSKEIGFPIEISKKAKNFICRKGYSEEFGVRPMKRVIKKYIENKLTSKIIAEEIKKDNIVLIDIDEKENILIKNK